MPRVCAILWRHLWSLWFHHIFRHYLINSTIFEEKVLNTKCVFLFSIQLLSKHFSFYEEFSEILSKMYKNSCKLLVILVGLSRNLKFLDGFSKKKSLKYQISSKSVQWKPSCCLRTDGHRRTDGYDKANSRFSRTRLKRKCLHLQLWTFPFYISVITLIIAAVISRNM